MPENSKSFLGRILSWQRPDGIWGLFAFCLAFLTLAAAARLNFRIADEGYLWYGAQRVLAGEIPLRDFMSYDPARYYLAGASMLLLGDRGPIAINLGAAFLAALAAWSVVRFLGRGRRDTTWVYWLLAIAAIVLWMVPRVKLFDITASIALVVMLAWLIEMPSLRRCLANGVCLGLVAIVGRNHGLYGAVADVVALLYLASAERRIAFIPALSCWAAGVVIGYSPMLLAALLVPGFFSALWASVHVYFEVGATNATLPVPWPWLALSQGWHGMQSARGLLHGLLLVAMPTFGVVVAGYCAWRALWRGVRADPLLLAAALLSIPYLHHALARADLAHLAQAMQPMLIGVLVLITGFPRYRQIALAVAVLAVSLVVAGPLQESYLRWSEGGWVEAQAGPDSLLVPPQVAARMAALDQLISSYAPQGREFVAVPELAGAYAIADRRAAVWDTYPVFPADDAVQQQEITRIQSEHPAFVLVEDMGHNRYGYPRTHPQVYDFITRDFVRLDPSHLPAGLNAEVYVPAGARYAPAASVPGPKSPGAAEKHGPRPGG